MRALFTAIKTQLLDNVTGIQHAQLWNNQVEMNEDGKHYSFPMPAVFVEFVVEGIKTLGDGYQLYDPLIVRLHIVHQMLDAGDGTMEQNLDVLDFKQDVYTCMHKFEPDGAVSFVRAGEEQDTDHGNVYHYIQSYNTNYIDAERAEPVNGIDSSSPITLTVETTIDDPGE